MVLQSRRWWLVNVKEKAARFYFRRHNWCLLSAKTGPLFISNRSEFFPFDSLNDKCFVREGGRGRERKRGRERERERERGNVGGTFLNVELTRQTWQKLCQHFRTKKLSLIFCLTTWLCYTTHTRTHTMAWSLSLSHTPTFSFSLSLYLSFSPQPKSHGKKYRPLDH